MHTILDLKLLLKSSDKIKLGYVIYKYKCVTFRISASYCIHINIKRRAWETFKNIHRYLSIFLKYIHRNTGKKICDFSFKVTNCQGRITLPSLKLEEHHHHLISLPSTVKKTIVPNEEHAFITCYTPFGSFQFRKDSVSFTLKNLEDIPEAHAFLHIYNEYISAA